MTVGAEDSGQSARDLFKEARQLVSEGKYDLACPKFERSLRLETGIGTQFNLADCWERSGRTASAHDLFLTVAAASKERGQPEREQAAARRAEALVPRLSRLQIQHELPAVKLSVSRDGIKLEHSNWSEPTPVDPGRYVVTLSSQGQEQWKTEVNVPAQALTVLLTVPPRANPDPGGKATKVTSLTTRNKRTHKQLKPKALAPSHARTNASQSYEDTSSIWPIVGLSVGGVAIGTGVMFALLFQSKNGQARDICPAGVGCTDSDIQKHDGLVKDAQAAKMGAYLGLGLGAASVAAATIYYAARPAHREKSPTAGLNIAPTLGAANQGFWGAVAQGTW
jgi:hypothetical protein